MNTVRPGALVTLTLPLATALIGKFAVVFGPLIALGTILQQTNSGFGVFQKTLQVFGATLAPILHWRVCTVWDWLRIYAPRQEFGGWPTAILADAYGGDDAEEVNARTGCTGCPLTSTDTALDVVSTMPQWSHLAPLKELKPLYRWMREPAQRLRKSGVERLKDGRIAKNPQRMGPLTLEARAAAALDKKAQLLGRVALGGAQVLHLLRGATGEGDHARKLRPEPTLSTGAKQEVCKFST